MCFFYLKKCGFTSSMVCKYTRKIVFYKNHIQKIFLIKVFDIDHLVSFEIYENQFF